jgi:GTP 3',8-cyclase
MSVIKPFTGVDDRLKLSKVIPLDTPFTLNIYSSNACNFKCIYCVQSLDHKILASKYNFKRDTMSLDIFNKIVIQAKMFPDKIKLVSFMGQGEPLLNPNLPEMVRITKEAKVADRVDIVTNASLLTNQKTDELIESGLDVLRISIQGINSEKYKTVSQVDIDFEEFISSIGYFYRRSRNKCKLFVKIIDASLDKGQDAYFYKLFDKITDRMFIEQIKPVYDAVNYDRFDISLLTDRRGFTHEKRHVCPQPFYVLSVWPNGDVIPCSAIHQVNRLGNVDTENLITMWNSKSLRAFQIMQLRKLRYKHDQCSVCCAPDDCAHPEDVLDEDAEGLLDKYQNNCDRIIE